MSELMNIIHARRSIRAYRSDPVPRELIDKVMEAGLYSASGMNRQAAIVIAVTDKALRDEISAANAAICGSPAGFDPFYGAPVILVVCCPKENPTGAYDGSLMLGSMMLEAHDLGLGSCWIHRAREEFETPLGQKILARAGLTGEYIGVGHLALGYCDGEYPAELPRKENRAFYAE